MESIDITVGSRVVKRSGKPFQNGHKVGTVEAVEPMTVPKRGGMKTVSGLQLEGCVGLVEAWRCDVIA